MLDTTSAPVLYFPPVTILSPASPLLPLTLLCGYHALSVRPVPLNIKAAFNSL